MDREEWRAIPGYEGYYEVSSHGRVRSLPRTMKLRGRWGEYERTIDGKIIRQVHGNSHWMYHSVCLHNGRDRPKRYFVHRLVCEAFNGPPPQGEKRIVAHNDGDWRNNYYANLRWATYLENSADAKAHGRTCKGTRNKIAKLNDDKVREIRSAEGVTQRELARRFGVSQSQIWMVRSRKSWRHL